MADTNERSINRTVFTLKDFTECYTPPRTFKVLGGRGLYSNTHTTALRVGDSLYLHTLAVEWICLSFFDADTGVRRDVKVPPDSQVRFNIVHKTQETFERIYTTVADLLEVWPTLFQANYGHEDNYLPQIFKKGERFKFIRRAQNPNDRNLYLECEDESGSVLTLPSTCRGDFTVLDDPKSYTLQEIVSFGGTERKIKLSAENIQLTAVNEHEYSFYTNVGNNDDILSKLTGLPLTYKGLITMQKPKFYVIVSPQDNHDVKWKISLEEEVEVMDQLDDYLPATRDMLLSEFVDNFELDLPVIARVSSYNNKIPQFQNHISPGKEVIVHRVDKDVDRILASTQSETYCLGSDVKGKFRKSSRRFKSVQEVLETREKIKLQVSEEIACDFPEPFCLKCGSILKCTNFNIQNIKIRYGKKIYGECSVVQWEIFGEIDERGIIRLPADLEVAMVEILDDDFDVANVLQYRLDLPVDAISLGSDNFLPFDQSICFEHYVSDPLVLISTIPENNVSGLDAKINLCLIVPLRHELTLHLRERLHFPPSYFILPRRAKWLSTGAEKITRDTYNSLIQYNDQAYEDYHCKGENVQVAPGSTKLVDRMKERVQKRFSQLTLKMSRSSSHLVETVEAEKVPEMRRDASFQSETNVSASSNNSYEGDARYDDSNIYEDYTGAMSKQDKSRKSLGRSLLRKFSRRGKR